MLSLVVALGAACGWLGCDRARDKSASTASPASSQPASIRVGYIGLTCEAPLFTAYEKGFFKDEGLEPEMVKCDWTTFKDAMGLGKIDVTHTLVMYLLKPM